ncbi:MAG: hypothetical protein ACTSP2_03545 [Alphaproteobacteria bacterium]
MNQDPKGAFSRRYALSETEWKIIQPTRRNRRDPVCFSPYLYRERNQVERYFNQIKHLRRITTHYEKRAVNFLACQAGGYQALAARS